MGGRKDAALGERRGPPPVHAAGLARNALPTSGEPTLFRGLGRKAYSRVGVGPATSRGDGARRGNEGRYAMGCTASAARQLYRPLDLLQMALSTPRFHRLSSISSAIFSSRWIQLVMAAKGPTVGTVSYQQLKNIVQPRLALMFAGLLLLLASLAALVCSAGLLQSHVYVYMLPAIALCWGLADSSFDVYISLDNFEKINAVRLGYLQLKHIDARAQLRRSLRFRRKSEAGVAGVGAAGSC